MNKKVKKALSITLAVVVYTVVTAVFWLAVFFQPEQLGM